MELTLRKLMTRRKLLNPPILTDVDSIDTCLNLEMCNRLKEETARTGNIFVTSI